MSKPTELIGWFAVPAEYMKELQVLVDKAESTKQRDQWFSENPLFERARALARTSAVFERRQDASLAMFTWYQERIGSCFPITLTNPDQRASLIPRLQAVRDEEVAAWMREHAAEFPDTDPAYVVECVRAMFRVFTSEPAERLWVIKTMHNERPAPPEKDDLLGWFAVPAAHMAEMHTLWTEAREALIARRDHHCYEPRNRLFERARAVATEAAVFPWYPATRYQDACFILWRCLRELGALETAPGPLTDPDQRKALARALGRVPTRRVTRWVREYQAWFSREMDVEPKVVGELFKALVRVLGSSRKRGLGLVKTWWTFEDRDQAYEDEDMRREVMPIARALRDTRLAAEARQDDAVFRQAEAELTALIQTHPWVPGVLLDEVMDELMAADRRAAIYEEMGWDPEPRPSR